MKKAYFLLIILLLVAVLGLMYYFLVSKQAKADLPAADIAPQKNSVAQPKTVDFTAINPEFLFSASLPREFEVEYLPAIKAINVYNPNASGKNNREKSQMYVTFFKASRFLTLSTVIITRQDKISINGNEAILYEITKKETVPNFAGQPLWRNAKHVALDIRYSQDSPTYFYSFAQNPDLPQKTFDDIINSLVFVDR